MRLSHAHLFSENVFFFFFFFFFFASVRKSTHPPCVRSPFRKTSPPRRRVLESSNASTSRHAAKQNSDDVFETSRAFTFHRLKKWMSKRLKRARVRSYFKDLSRRPFSNRFPIKTFRERITPPQSRENLLFLEQSCAAESWSRCRLRARAFLYHRKSSSRSIRFGCARGPRL